MRRALELVDHPLVLVHGLLKLPASEIRYGRLPALKKELDDKLIKLQKLQKNRRVLKEEITAEDVEVVSRWTGIPLNQVLEIRTLEACKNGR